MKKFLASGMFSFLTVCATMTAKENIDIIYDHAQGCVISIENFLKTHENDEYWKGQKDAFKHIVDVIDNLKTN